METSEQLRQRYIASATRIVVKVGTNVLASPGMPLDEERVDSLSEQIGRLVTGGRQVALVTSGAIGAGMAELGMSERPRTLPLLQASASVGQGKLMSFYEKCFHDHGLHGGQILLTREDFDSRTRYLNARNTMNELFGLRCVPVINENDTISTDEIKFGDNDSLAAMVTHLIRADLLILLSSVPGLYVEQPAPKAVQSVHTGASGRAVADIVTHVDDEVAGVATKERSAGGTGGMDSKLQAVRVATQAGEAAVIADGKADDILIRLVSGEKIGTLFLPASSRMSSRKRWLGYTSRPRGSVIVDDGARRALATEGKSLLPSGVTAVEGEFETGDVIRIKGPDGREFARGLSNYSSADCLRIKGLKTNQIESVLGQKFYDEIVHRDNMVVVG